MKYLGIDFGTKRIGLAVSDEEGKVAFANKVIQNTPATIDELSQFIETEEIEFIVIGESKDFDMKDNKIMDQVREFAEKLKEGTNLPVTFHTELLTSAQAATENHFALTPREQKVRGEKKSENIDAQAAALMLQSYLDTK